MSTRFLGVALVVLLTGCGAAPSALKPAAAVSAMEASAATGIGTKIIQAGLKYKNTPYVFNSDREDKETMDCSEFVRWAYRDAANITLPTNSRTQAQWVKDHGHFKTDWHDLQAGDLMFFYSYKGTDRSAYDDIDPQKQRISHVALYMGDGKMLHTFSQESGGVHVQRFEKGSYWDLRFVGGGSGLK